MGLVDVGQSQQFLQRKSASSPPPSTIPSPQSPTVAASSSNPPPAPQPDDSLLGEIRSKKFYILKAGLVAAAFWLVEFAYQYFFTSAGDLGSSLVRSFSFSGATLIGIALAMGPLAQLKPEWNFVEYRRTFGVAGFTFAILHYFSVLNFFYQFNLGALYFDLNPFKNPILFGTLAFLFFIPLYLTSTDWAISKLGFRTWKTIHRLVYFAFLFLIAHFVLINPPLLQNPAGYLLIAVSFTTLALELAAFAKKVRAGKAGMGAWAGAAITLFALLLFAGVFLFRSLLGG